MEENIVVSKKPNYRMLLSSTFPLPGELRQRFSGTSAGTFNSAGFTIHLQVHSMQQDSQYNFKCIQCSRIHNSPGLEATQADVDYAYNGILFHL